MWLFRLVGKTLFAISCLIGSYGYAVALAAAVRSQPITPTVYAPFLGGGAFFLILWLLFLSRRESFWGVMEHELTHALFALLFFKRVRGLSAHRLKGGSVWVEGGNFVIALSPYCFPLLTAVLLLLKPIVYHQYQPILNGLIGFTFTFHLIDLLHEFHPQQTDIRHSGVLFSIAVVLFSNIFFTGLVIASLPGNGSGMIPFLKNGFSESAELFRMLLTRIYSHFGMP